MTPVWILQQEERERRIRLGLLTEDPLFTCMVESYKTTDVQKSYNTKIKNKWRNVKKLK